MKRVYWVLGIVIVALVFTGCSWFLQEKSHSHSDDSDENTTENIFTDDFDDLPENVQEYILDNDDETVQEILIDYAISTEKYLSLSNDEMDARKDEIVAEAREIDSMDCLSYLYGASEAYDILLEMESEMVNTKERFLAYNHLNSLYSGEDLGSVTYEEIVEYCEEHYK